MDISDEGLSLIKEFEKCKLEAYWDNTGKVWTIGWGHTSGVKEGDAISQSQADAFLRQDTASVARSIDRLHLRVNNNQFDALCSLCYNIGIGNFLRSTLLKKVRIDPNDLAIADEFSKHKFSGGIVLPGLVRRRAKEAQLYFA
jgi:lysozyme